MTLMSICACIVGKGYTAACMVGTGVSKRKAHGRKDEMYVVLNITERNIFGNEVLSKQFRKFFLRCVVPLNFQRCELTVIKMSKKL